MIEEITKQTTLGKHFSQPWIGVQLLAMRCEDTLAAIEEGYVDQGDIVRFNKTENM